MGDSARQQHGSHPVMRVYTFGEFVLERLVSPQPPAAHAPRYERVAQEEWRSRGPAKTLLKVLLCRIRRRASREELLEALWPEEESIDRAHAFDATVSVLRRVMRTQSGESLLARTRTGGVTIFSLPGQERLWADADAFLGFIDQAMRAKRAGADPLPHLEAARALVTGEFLEDDLYSDWAEPRRQMINAAHHRCLHYLADLYSARNMLDQAEAVLHSSLIDNPTDEDVLCRLLLLLEEQGRCQEAWQLYEQTARLLDEELHTMPMQRTRALAGRLQSAHLILHDTARHTSAPPSRLADAQRPMPAEIGFSTGYLQFSTAPAPSLLKTLDTAPSRRQVLQAMLSLASAALVLPPQEVLGPDAWERLALVSRKPSSIDTSALEDLETITKSYWRLRANTASVDLLHGVLGHFQTVIDLLRHPLPTATFRQLCAIGGETAQILGQMLFDMQDYSTAWSYYSLALHAAQEARHEDLWAVGLGRMSFLLTYSDQAREALPLLEEAERLAQQSAHPIIRSWLAVVEAEAQAHVPDAEACSRALDRAKESAVQYSFGVDPYATGLNPSRLAGYQGVCFVRLQQPEMALPALQEALALLPLSAVRRRSMLLTDMAAAHMQLGAVEQACVLASQAASLTVETRSHSVLQRLRHLRHDLEPWSTTSVVRGFDEQMAALQAALSS